MLVPSAVDDLPFRAADFEEQVTGLRIQLTFYIVESEFVHDQQIKFRLVCNLSRQCSIRNRTHRIGH